MTTVRVCNYVKIATGQNFPPVLKIVTRLAQAAYNVNVAMHARDQCSIFSAVQKFCPDYGLLLELHALTLVLCALGLAMNQVNFTASYQVWHEMLVSLVKYSSCSRCV